MNVDYLIQILQNKILILNNAKNMAFSNGDIETINAIDKQLFESQTTLSQLEVLRMATEMAAANNISTAEVITNSINALQTSVQGPNAGAIINGYDVSAYATDTLYEQKILNILGAMPVFASTAEIDAYIQSFAPGSPVTGSMIEAAATVYAIDLPLLTAIMQNDSQFGTTGIGARTNNPGNVGNTGTSTQSYPSWAEGVAAVAEWLSRHRAAPVAEVPAAAVVAETVTESITPPEEVEKPKRKKRIIVEDASDPVPVEPEVPETPPIIPEPEPPATTTSPVDDTASSTNSGV